MKSGGQMNENNYGSDGAVTAGVAPMQVSTDGLPIELIDPGQPNAAPPRPINPPPPPQNMQPPVPESLDMGPSPSQQMAPPMPQENSIPNEIPQHLDPVPEPPMMEQNSFNNKPAERTTPRFFNQIPQQQPAPQQAMPQQQPMMEQPMPTFNNNPMNQGMDFSTGMQPIINPDEIFTTGMPPKQKNNNDLYNPMMDMYQDMNQQPMMDQQYYPDMNQQPMMDQQYYPDMNQQPMMNNNGGMYNQQNPSISDVLPEKPLKMKNQEQIGKAIGFTLISLAVFEIAFLFLLNGAIRDFITKIFKITTEIKLIDLTEDSIKALGRANAVYIIISNLFITGISWLAVKDRFRKVFLSINDQTLYIIAVSIMSTILHAIYLGCFWKQTSSQLTQFEDYTGFDVVNQLTNTLHNTRIVAVIAFAVTVALSIFVIFKETKRRNRFVNF